MKTKATVHKLSMSEVTINNIVLCYSYKTLICIRDLSTNSIHINDTKYSVTTSEHLSTYLENYSAGIIGLACSEETILKTARDLLLKSLVTEWTKEEHKC